MGKKIIVRVLIFGMICLGIGNGIYRLLKPDTSIMDGRNETANVICQGFDNLDQNVLDYLMVGSSNVFMDVSPVHIWDKFGYTGYNYASPEQRMDVSLFYIQQALQTQSPKVIFLDCYYFGIDGNTTESYTHLGLDYFDLSKEKKELIDKMGFSDTVKNDYYNDFILYHSRWKELKSGDFNMLKYNVEEDFLGYSPSYFSLPASMKPLSMHNEQFSISETQYDMMKQIVQVCKEKGTELVLIKTPNNFWTVEQNEKVQEAAEKLGVKFIDFNTLKIVKSKKDFCDGGGHCNNDGAEKVSEWLGNYMSQNFSMEGRNGKSREVCDYFDTRKESLEQFEQNVLLSQERDWETYWSMINDEDYVVLVSALRNGATADILKNKINIPYDAGADMCVSFMLDAGIPINQNCKKYVEEAGIFTQNIYDHIFYVETDVSEANSIDSKVQIDYQNYGMGKDVNLVIFDKVTEQVIDTSYVEIEENGSFIVKHHGE